MVDEIVPQPGQETVSRPLKKWLWLLGFILVIVGFLLAVPPAIKYGLQRWLHQQGNVQTAIDDIDFNPFTGRFELSSLHLSGAGGQRCVLEAIHFDIAVLALFRGRFQVQEITLVEGDIDLTANPKGGWVVAGVPVAAAEPDDSGGQTTKTWLWGVDKLRLRNIKVRYQQESWQEELLLSKVDVDGFATWQEQGAGTFSLSAGKGEGLLDLKGKCAWRQSGVVVEGVLAADRFPAQIFQHVLPPDFTKLRGSLTSRQQLRISVALPLEKNNIEIHTAGKIQAEKLFFTGYGQHVSGSLAADIESTLNFLSTDSSPQPIIKAKAEATLEDVLVYDSRKNLTRASVDSVTLKGLEVVKDEVQIKQIGLGSLKLFQRPGRSATSNDGQGYIIAMPELRLADVSLNSKHVLQVMDIKGKDTKWFVERNQQGRVAIVDWLTSPVLESGATSSPPFIAGVRLQGLRLLGNNTLELEDHSPATLFREELSSFEFVLGAVDSQQPAQPSPLTLQASIGRYANLNLKGTWSPLADRLTMEVAGRLESLRLPTFNPYIIQYYDYSFKSGNIDADIDFKVNQGLVKSELKLLIQKVAYERLKEGQKSTTKKISGMPLDYMVDMLRDKKNNIKLHLAVEGDLDNPDFDYTGALLQAGAATAKKTTVSYFAPLGVTMLTGISLPMGTAYVAGKVVKWATTMRFEPVLFAAKSASLSRDAEHYLDTMATLLLERPGVDIVLCGKAIVAEGDGGQAGGALSAQEHQFLIELAKKRAEAVKDYLIQQGVAANRLVICAADIDTSDKARPRVDVAL